MRLTLFSPSLLLSAVMLMTGCMASQTTSVPTTAPHGGAVGFFEQGLSTGSISIRLVDNRRSTQAFADVADFSAVRFELRNSAKLKAPRLVGVSATGGSYGTVFTDLPSDTEERYTLTAGLFSGIFTPGDLADSGYSNLDQKVGEGVSAAFSIAPGDNKTITLVINAVGEMTLASTATTIDNANPTFTAGDATAKGQITLSTVTNPSATALKYYVLDAANATQSVATLASSAWVAPPAKTSLPFTAPATAGTYRLVADMVAGDLVLSRRIRSFTVAAPSVTSVIITGSSGSFAVNNTPFTGDSSTTYTFPASGSTVSLPFTNNSDEYMTIGVNDPVYGKSYIDYLPPNASRTIVLPVFDGEVPLIVELAV